jgi:uncharacterized protein
MIFTRKLRRTQNLLFAISLSLLSLGTSSYAEKVQDLKPANYVNDFAGVIDPATQAQLNALALELQTKAHAQVAIVTVKSLEDKPVEDFAVELFKAWGVGGKSDNRGVLILLSSSDRKYRVEVGYGLEPILPDGKVGGFGREMVPILRQGNYSAALSLLTTRIGQTIAQDSNVQLTGAPQLPHRRHEPAAPLTLLNKIFIGIVIIIVLAILVTNPGLLFALLLSGGGGGGRSSSGGFGGGGGFGGFGGGSSGGGGASGSW